MPLPHASGERAVGHPCHPCRARPIPYTPSLYPHPSSTGKDYYQILGVPKDATEDAIKKAYRK